MRPAAWGPRRRCSCRRPRPRGRARRLGAALPSVSRSHDPPAGGSSIAAGARVRRPERGPGGHRAHGPLARGGAARAWDRVRRVSTPLSSRKIRRRGSSAARSARQAARAATMSARSGSCARRALFTGQPQLAQRPAHGRAAHRHAGAFQEPGPVLGQAQIVGRPRWSQASPAPPYPAAGLARRQAAWPHAGPPSARSAASDRPCSPRPGTTPRASPGSAGRTHKPAAPVCVGPPNRPPA